MATAQIPSLDALPVVGVDDDLQTVISARQKLQASFVMVGQILDAPSGLPTELKTNINNIKFYLTTALSAIDSYLFTGNAPTQQAGNVPNLREAIAGHIQAIRQARPSWDNWVATVKPPEVPPPIPKVSPLVPAAAASSPSSSALESMSAPTPLRTYMTIGGVALGVLLLMKLSE